MMIRCIKNVCSILWNRERCDSRDNSNAWLNKLVNEMVETLQDVKNDLLAAKELASRAVNKLNILDEKIRDLKKKVADGLGVTQTEIDELGALSQGVKDALTQVNVEADEATSIADEQPPAGGETPPAGGEQPPAGGEAPPAGDGSGGSTDGQ